MKKIYILHYHTFVLGVDEKETLNVYTNIFESVTEFFRLRDTILDELSDNCVLSEYDYSLTFDKDRLNFECRKIEKPALDYVSITLQEFEIDNNN